MTNDLHEQQDQQLPEALETPVAPEQAVPVPPAPEPEKTVFGPSLWEQVKDKHGTRGGRSRAGLDDMHASRAEREAQRQEKAAEREAKKLELKIAQEQRKAQEEERRREQKARDEERRQQSRQREEEQRQFRREERAKESRVRRVGTMTLGLALIAIGGALATHLINPGFDLRVVAYLAPVILISLGVEILLRYFFSKDKTYKYDFASGVICIFLVMGSFCVSLVPYLAYYISPERFASEEQLLDAEREKLYQAFKGDQRVADFYVSGGIDGSFTNARRDEEGKWTYELDYLYTNISLLDGCDSDEAFAQVCRELMDKMVAQNIMLVNNRRYNGSSINFSCPENKEGISYQLSVDNRLQMEMDPQNLVKLVETIYSRPTRDNGWFPAGYEEIRDNFGTKYAEHFAWLMEFAGIEAAGDYYTTIMDYHDIERAESYYLEYMDGYENAPAGDPDETEDTPEGEEPPVDEGEPEGEEPPAGEGEPEGEEAPQTEEPVDPTQPE